MKIAIGIFILSLIALFIWVIMSIWKKVRKVIIGVRSGYLSNQTISKIIKKAETTGRIEYTIARPIIGSMFFSFIYLFIKFITDKYFLELQLKPFDFLFTFLFMFVVWAIIGIIISHKIWNLCRQE